jgi:3-oxoacyl-[acyl-carrier protein] reductase
MAAGPPSGGCTEPGGPPPTPAAGQPPQLWSAQFQSMVLSVIAITDRYCPECASAAGAG